MHHWGGLDSLRAQSCHVCNQQNYYKKAFFRMYVRIKSQPTISQVYNKLKNWQHPEKNNKNDNHFFYCYFIISDAMIKWVFPFNHFLQVGSTRKKHSRGTEGNCFPFQTSSFVSVLPLVLLFKTQTFCITDRYLVYRRKFLQKL